MNQLPYRLGVGAVIFNRHGLILVARRADLPIGASPQVGWQLPQGGIDEGENPRSAILRELKEEIGTNSVKIMAEHSDWLTYELPQDVVGSVWQGRYRGQRQRWFAMRFLGSDDEIRLDQGPFQEFDTWRWVELARLPDLAVPFKREIYEVLANSFEMFSKGCNRIAD